MQFVPILIDLEISPAFYLIAQVTAVRLVVQMAMGKWVGSLRYEHLVWG